MKKALIATGFLTCILVANNASAEYDTVPANSITIGKFTLPDFGGGSSGCTNIQFDSQSIEGGVMITPMCYDATPATSLGESFTVMNGGAGSSGCWTTSWGDYTAPTPADCGSSNANACTKKGSRNLIIAPTHGTDCSDNYGGVNPVSTTVPMEDKCDLARRSMDGDIYNCKRLDNNLSYKWKSQSMAITKTYYETKDGKPGYIETKSGDTLIGTTVDRCPSANFAMADKTVSGSTTKRVIRATQTCYVGDLTGVNAASGNTNTWTSNQEYSLETHDLPDDELSYDYYASADGMPGYLVTTKNGVAGPNVYDSICEYEVLARGTQNASTNTTYKAGALKKRCQVQPLPTGTTKHDTNLNEGEWYDVAGANPKELPDDDPYVYKYTRASGEKGVLTKYIDKNNNGQGDDSVDTEVSSTEDYECTNSITAKDTTNKLGGIKQTCKVQNFDKTKTNRPSGAAYEPGYSYELASEPIPTPSVCDLAETGQTKKVTRTYVAHTTTKRGYYQTSTTKCGSNTADDSYEYDRCSPAKDTNGTCTGNNQAYMACTQGDDNTTPYQICESLGSGITPLSKHVDDVNATATAAKNKAEAALPADQLAEKLQAEMTNNNGVLKDVTEKANAALPADQLAIKLQAEMTNNNGVLKDVADKADAALPADQLATKLQAEMTNNNGVLKAALDNKANASALSDYVAKDGNGTNSFGTLLNTAMTDNTAGSLGAKLSAAETAANTASRDAADAVAAVAAKASLSDLVTAINGASTADGVSAEDDALGVALRAKIDTAVNAMLNDTNSRLSQTIQAAADSRQ